MSVRLQAVVSDDLAAHVVATAQQQRRSVSELIGQALEERLGVVSCVGCGELGRRGPDGPDFVCDDCHALLVEEDRQEAKKVKRPEWGQKAAEVNRGRTRSDTIALGGDPDCAHGRVEKRETSFGVQRFCRDCDLFLPS